MNKKRSNRPFRGHGSIEDEFVFEEVSMDDSPRVDENRRSNRKSNGKRSAEEGRKSAKKTAENRAAEKDFLDTAAVSEKEIDEMVAGFVSAQTVSGRKNRQKNNRAHIASNPSVNPTKTKTVLVDGVKVANTRLHLSVEEEMKSRGIKKLPNGVSAADLAIPSYDTVVTSAERRPLDCVLFHDFQENGLSPLDEMMRKSMEKSAKGKKNQNSKKEEKGSRKSEKGNGKTEEKAEKCDSSKNAVSKKTEKKNRKECAEQKRNAKSAELKKDKSAKKFEKQAHEQNAVPAAGTVSVQMPNQPTVQTAFQPSVQSQMQAQMQPQMQIPGTAFQTSAIYPNQMQNQIQNQMQSPVQTAGTISMPGMDPAIRAELLKQQEMLLNMIHQCHQTLASIQTQLLTPVSISPTAPVQAVQAVQAVAPAQPAPIQILSPIQANPSVAAVSTVPPMQAQGTFQPEISAFSEATETFADEESSEKRKLSRRERHHLKKLREAEEKMNSDTYLNEETDEISSEETREGKKHSEKKDKEKKKGEKKCKKEAEMNSAERCPCGKKPADQCTCKKKKEKDKKHSEKSDEKSSRKLKNADFDENEFTSETPSFQTVRPIETDTETFELPALSKSSERPKGKKGRSGSELELKKSSSCGFIDPMEEFPEDFVSADEMDSVSEEKSDKKKAQKEGFSAEKNERFPKVGFAEAAEETFPGGKSFNGEKNENFTENQKTAENSEKEVKKGKKKAEKSVPALENSKPKAQAGQPQNSAKSKFNPSKPEESTSVEAGTGKSPKTSKSARKDERLKQLLDSDFGKMGLSKELLFALDDAQYATPSRIQSVFIPAALTGEDVMGQAQTGTGKTAAFAIPILQMIEFDEDSFDPQALILVPTRELAVQVKDEFEKLAKYTDLECIALYGGKPLPPQVQQLRAGVDIVIGTPGRVMDHIKRGSLKLRNLKIAVLDEADRMLDIGFRPDIEKILRMAPQSRQSLLLSATIPPSVEAIARKYMREPEILDCSQKDISSETIEQFYFTVDPELKFDLLLKLLDREDPKQAIIFCRTKRGVERVSGRLSKEVKSVEAIHGDLQQRRRDRVMASFRAGKTRYLVATDVVGRGIDVSGISHIINYDIPKFCDDYVHRVGRTGRMGHEGVAFTFVAPEEGNELTRIEMRINQLLKRDEIQGFSGLPSMTSAPQQKQEEENSEEKQTPLRRRRRL